MFEQYGAVSAEIFNKAQEETWPRHAEEFRNGDIESVVFRTRSFEIPNGNKKPVVSHIMQMVVTTEKCERVLSGPFGALPYAHFSPDAFSWYGAIHTDEYTISPVPLPPGTDTLRTIGKTLEQNDPSTFNIESSIFQRLYMAALLEIMRKYGARCFDDRRKLAALLYQEIMRLQNEYRYTAYKPFSPEEVACNITVLLQVNILSCII